MTQDGHIEALYIYPIKSCAGTLVQSANLSIFGLKDDRQWMLVNDKSVMMTQRLHPRMALIRPELTETGLTLHHPELESIAIHLPHQEISCEVKIWNDIANATLLPETQNQAISEWLATALKYNGKMTLVKFNAHTLRSPGQPERFGKTAKHFTDAAPLLITNTASINALNQTLKQNKLEQVDMRSFRPNIVISGPEAFSEHTLTSIKLHNSSTVLHLVDHCQRCVMITVNPDTGVKRSNAVPFQTLVALNAMPDNLRAPAFGVNAMLEQAPYDQDATPAELTIGARLAFT